jgi:hypothetical protein
MGFVGKNRAQDMLLERPPGTFLLRFSDSELGGISVAWMSLDQDGHRKVWHLQPWFAKDLVIRSLADRCVLLFPCPPFFSHEKERG